MSMTPFSIDLRPSVPKAAVAAWVASVLLIAVACLLAWMTFGVKSEIEAVRKRIAQTNGALKTLEARLRAIEARPPYSAAMNELVLISTFPLNDVFDALERVDVPGVRVVELEIDASQRQATSVLEAVSAESLQAYLEGAVTSGKDGGWQLQEIRSGNRQGSGSSAIQATQSPVPLPAEPTTVVAATGFRVKMVWRHSAVAELR